MTTQTPDVTIFFVLWLDHARRSTWRRFLFNRKALFDITLWHFGESGAFYHWYDTETEQNVIQTQQAPASMRRRIQFYDDRSLPLHRPNRSEYVNRTQAYPLVGTDEIIVCMTCSGQGTIRCTSCHGNGRCSSCGGRGKTGTGQNSQNCAFCTGGRCRSCNGRGRKTCFVCNGEGRLVRFQEREFVWKHHHEEEPILNEQVDHGRIQALIRDVAHHEGSIEVESFDLEAIEDCLGFSNHRHINLVRHASQESAIMEQKVQSYPGQILFRDIFRKFQYLGFLNLNIGEKYRQFFISGNKRYTAQSTPKVGFSFAKTTAWLVLFGCLIGWIGELSSWWELPRSSWVITLVSTLLLTALAVYRIFADGLIAEPERVVIFDEDNLSGWLFLYLLATALAKSNRAMIRDPGLLMLLEDPRLSQAKGRNSFFCTMVEKSVIGQRTAEIVNICSKAQDVWPEHVAEISGRCKRLIWVFGNSPVSEADQRVSNRLSSLKASSRPGLEITIVSPSPDFNHGTFTRTTAALSAEQIRFIRLPLSDMFRASKSGEGMGSFAEEMSALEAVRLWT